MTEGITEKGDFDEKTLEDAEFCRSKCTRCIRGREKINFHALTP